MTDKIPTTPVPEMTDQEYTDQVDQSQAEMKRVASATAEVFDTLADYFKIK